MQAHQLRTISQPRKRIGRGGKRGKTSGRGHKGQLSRSGRNLRPAERDVFQRIPKRRGHNRNRARGVRPRTPSAAVNVSALESAFSENTHITPIMLANKGLIASWRKKHTSVKILGKGAITKPLHVHGCLVSTVATDKIKKAGGTILHQ